jgi:hypothetical protein
VRHDAATGIREEARFLGPAAHRLFTVTAYPPGTPAGGVLICPPFGADSVANYRREVALARALAAAGLAAVRFHYRGTGNSDGDPAATTLDSMRDDVVDATTAVGAAIDGPPGLVATRLASLVAAAAAPALGAPALALWEPVLEGRRFLRDAVRASRMREISTGGPRPAADGSDGAAAAGGGHAAAAAATNGVGHAAAAADGGGLDVVGYRIPQALSESCAARRLVDDLEAASALAAVLLVGFGPGSELGRPLDAAATTLRDRGVAVTAQVVPTEETWWFARSTMAEHEAVVGVTCAWLREALA